MTSGAAAMDCSRRDDTILCCFLDRQIWKHILAARDLDQLGHPADAADQRIVPQMHGGEFAGQLRLVRWLLSSYRGRGRRQISMRYLAGPKSSFLS